MSKSTSKSFTQFYNEYCRQHQLKSKVHLLDNKYLKLNADRLEKEDWTPIIKALKNHGTDLHSIIVYREHLHKYQLSNTIRLKQSLIHHEPAFLKEPLLKILIEAIVNCMSNSDIFCSLSLEAFPIENYFDLLINSIDNQTCLQHLALPYCNLSEEDLIRLCTMVSTHTGLQTINLTGCGITIKGAKRIASLIRSQKLVRYAETWKQSLRYRLPQPDIVPGLRRLTLNNNSLIGDEGFAEICYEMIDDLWIRAIDFQNCGITSQSIETAVELIEKNPVLRVLDLRCNEVPPDFLKHILIMLNNNNKNDDDDKNIYNWINSTDTRRSISNISIKQQRVQFPKNISSMPTRKISCNTINRKPVELCRSNKITGSLKGVEELGKPIHEKCFYRKAHTVIGELEKTKSILKNVSNKLSEERNKREELEKQQQKYKDQLHEIRSCLQIHRNIGRNDDGSTISNSTEITSKDDLKLKKDKEPNTNDSKHLTTNDNKIKNGGTSSKNTYLVMKNITTEDSKFLVNKSLKSAKLFLLVPKDSYKNSFKYVKSLDDKQIIAQLNNVSM